MSKITLDNLSDNLKEYLNGLGLSEEQVLNLINENGLNEEELKAMLKDTMSINELSTNSKTVIGAINELFQSANNGKQLIASAIGEPLNSEDTFSAMSNDINGLLSTFKTNMMNNGVTVESSDRFKQLIDKIATMVEEGSGKGVQFATGTTTQVKSYLLFNGNDEGYTLRYDKLPFTPTIMFINLGDLYNTSSYSGIGGDSGDYNAVTKNLLGNNIILFSENDLMIALGNFVESGVGLRITNITDSSCYIEPTDKDASSSSAWYFKGPFTYYAIGVGEEDTTLRDSLASILTEEGVEVTEEDDMASLISKVDTAFDNLVPKKIYLYNRGTEYTTITLGTGNGVQKKESDHLYINGANFNGALTSGGMTISYTYNKGDENKYLYLDLNSTGGNLVIGDPYYGDGVKYTLGGRGLLRLDLSEGPSFTSFAINSTDNVRIYEMYISNM